MPGIEDLAMTTNGLMLDKLAATLAQAGLKRVNISIDTLDAAKFKRITRWGDIDDVWRGIEAAEAAGLRPIKLNCVVIRGFNDSDVVDLARLTVDRDWDVRFIEMMPFGESDRFSTFQCGHFPRDAGPGRGGLRAAGRGGVRFC